MADCRDRDIDANRHPPDASHRLSMADLEKSIGGKDAYAAERGAVARGAIDLGRQLKEEQQILKEPDSKDKWRESIWDWIINHAFRGTAHALEPNRKVPDDTFQRQPDLKSNNVEATKKATPDLTKAGDEPSRANNTTTPKDCNTQDFVGF